MKLWKVVEKQTAPLGPRQRKPRVTWTAFYSVGNTAQDAIARVQAESIPGGEWSATEVEGGWAFAP